MDPEDKTFISLSTTENRVLDVLIETAAPVASEDVAVVLEISSTVAAEALAALSNAGLAISRKAGSSKRWQIAPLSPSIRLWLEKTKGPVNVPSTGSSPYSTGGGGVRLEQAYAACLVAGLLAGDALPELGDALVVDSIRLQASDISEVDDVVIEGHDAQGRVHRSSIAVRRDPTLTTSDEASVPLIRDFLAIVTAQWDEVSSGRWKLVLAVSTNSNAIAQLSELAELAQSLPDGDELGKRLLQPGRTNAAVRDRYGHIKSLVAQAARGLPTALGLSAAELTWRFLSSLSTRKLSLERTARTDRTIAVNSLRRMLQNGTTKEADALFARIQELVGEWAPQAAVLTQTVVRRRLHNYPLSRSAIFESAWTVFDRLGMRLRDSISPALRGGTESLELERPAEKTRLRDAMRKVGNSAGSLVVTGDPDVGKSALCLRVAEELREEGASVAAISLRDLPFNATEFEVQLGGQAIDDIFAAGEVRPIRLLLVDGAESVLEGKGQLFRTVAAAALNAGYGVVAVTRSDGSRQVRDELEKSCRLAAASVPDEYTVEPLRDEDRDALSVTFPALSRLAADPRTQWLLGRLGLVDVLLRTGEDLDPAKFMCEADVFITVWMSLIRSNEIRLVNGASPDDREQAALQVAKWTLGIPASPRHGTAAAELRSNGVLRVPNNPALSPGDEFSTDLFRDFALCRLFISEGWTSLNSAGAPRWSIRAARLGCQSALISSSLPNAWTRLTSTFKEIAAVHGDRWLEVPHEALLTLGDASSAIRQLWGALTENNCSALITLLRLAEGRYMKGSVGDTFALAPLVKVAFCDAPEVPSSRMVGSHTVREAIQVLVLGWLRGMAVSSPQPDRLRQEVRDFILDGGPPNYDGFAIEALALMGSDLNSSAISWLQKTAQNQPDRLSDAMESAFVAASMSQHHPSLLLELAESYYIEQLDPNDPWAAHDYLSDGIRGFNHGSASFGAPAAAWYYGPFFRLLHTVPRAALKFINRMLDHAARHRVEKLSAHLSNEPDAFQGLELDLIETGARLYVGDSHVWSWYRGTTVGPYACMSALLALEKFVDHLLENADISARRILELLLSDCQNLAIPGLLMGFLSRHPDQVEDLLDSFLSYPKVWHLETSRVSSEHFNVRDSDADKLAGSDKRGNTPHHTVASMVVMAKVSGNQSRLTELKNVACRLLENAEEDILGAIDEVEYRAMVEGWAALFHPDNYQASGTKGGVLIQFERPAEIEQVLAPRNQELEVINRLYRLQNRYGWHNADPEKWPQDEILEDMATARGMERDGAMPKDLHWSENPLAAVAAAGLRAHALGLAVLEDADLVWAAEAVLLGAEKPSDDEMTSGQSTFPVAADRAAAAAVPLLLLAPFDHLKLDRVRVEKCMWHLSTNHQDEVRATFAKGCEPVWAAACKLEAGSGLCLRHQAVWDAATGDLIASRLGHWNQRSQRRDVVPLSRPFNESLTEVAGDDLRVEHLRAPLASMVDAREVGCLRQFVDDLWAPLWSAHCRGLAHRWNGRYDGQSHVTHEPIARRMILTAVGGDQTPAKSHIEMLAADSNALHLLFTGFASVFTYDDELRKCMPSFWPWALKTALDALGDAAELRSRHHWFDYMTAALLPTPSPKASDPDIDGTFSRCRANWLQPGDLGELPDQWIVLARGQAKAVDAVIKFAKGAPPEWQASEALAWIERIIDGRFGQVANKLWLIEEWLTGLRSSGRMTGESRTRYHRIVDGLAAAGDRAAITLQQLDE